MAAHESGYIPQEINPDLMRMQLNDIREASARCLEGAPGTSTWEASCESHIAKLVVSREVGGVFCGGELIPSDNPLDSIGNASRVAIRYPATDQNVDRVLTMLHRDSSELYAFAHWSNAEVGDTELPMVGQGTALSLRQLAHSIQLSVGVDESTISGLGFKGNKDALLARQAERIAQTLRSARTPNTQPAQYDAVGMTMDLAQVASAGQYSQTVAKGFRILSKGREIYIRKTKHDSLRKEDLIERIHLRRGSFDYLLQIHPDETATMQITERARPDIETDTDHVTSGDPTHEDLGLIHNTLIDKFLQPLE